MSEIHYFQRYSSKENAVTNATLHLFSRIYEHSTNRLKELLNEVFDADIPFGIVIRQQTRSNESVPDGFISQAAVSILIETKVDAGVSVDQLKRHLTAFSGGGENYLLLLTKETVTEAELTLVVEAAKRVHVEFTHNTFEMLCKHLKASVHPFETNLKAITDDFVAYCQEMGLLPDRRDLLRVVPCGASRELNRKYRIYYNPIYRGLIAQQYLGIYWSKSVRLIGKIQFVCDATLSGTTLTIIPVSGERPPDIDDRLRGIITETIATIGWNVLTGHRFFCVGEFLETDYRKTSPYGIQGHRIHDISSSVMAAKLLGEGGELSALAEVLRGETWT